MDNRRLPGSLEHQWVRGQLTSVVGGLIDTCLQGLELRIKFTAIESLISTSIPFNVTVGDNSCDQLRESARGAGALSLSCLISRVDPNEITSTIASTVTVDRDMVVSSGFFVGGPATAWPTETFPETGSTTDPSVIIGLICMAVLLAIAIAVIIFLRCCPKLLSRRGSSDLLAPVPFLGRQSMQRADNEGSFTPPSTLCQQETKLPRQPPPHPSTANTNLHQRQQSCLSGLSIISSTVVSHSPLTRTIDPGDPFADPQRDPQRTSLPTYVGRAASPAPTYTSAITALCSTPRTLRVVNGEEALIHEIAGRQLSEADVEAIAQRVAEISINKGIK
jgi:hypothetical protein